MGIGIAPKPPSPSHRSVLASTLLLAGSQALGILLAPPLARRGSFNDLRVNPGSASDTVPYIAGTPEITPHLISYFDFASKRVKNDAQVSEMLVNAGLSGLAGYLAGGGHFGGVVPDPPSAYIGLAEGTVLGAITAGLGQLRTASYRYYCGFLYGISHGPIDAITGIMVDDRLVSNGADAGDSFLIDDPQAWGGDHVDGGIYAMCDIIPGNFWPTQQPNPYLTSILGSNVASWSGKALFLIRGWSGFLESGYFAATPQGAPVVRPLKLRVRRIPSNLGTPDWANVNNGDANLAECAYEWLKSPTFGVKKLTDSHIDADSFRTAAEKLFNKNLGITVEMNSDTNVESALDTFCELGDMILYGRFNSGTIRLKVIERDYSIGSLPVFRRGPDGSNPSLYNVIRVEGFTPGSLVSAATDFTFSYKDRDNKYQTTSRYTQNLANMLLTGQTRSLSQTLEGVSNGETAAFVGTREMRAGSYPRPPITLIVNRDGYLREPGDVIRFIDNVDDYQLILRIGEVQKIATDDESDIALVCTEDQYGVGASAFNPFVPPGFVLNLRHLVLFEDDMNLTDGFGMQVNSPQNQGFTDSFGLSDSFTFELLSPFALSFSDTLNNWADTVATSSGAEEFDILFMAGAEHEANADQKWDVSNALAPVSGVADAHGLVYDNATWGSQNKNYSAIQSVTARARKRLRVSSNGQALMSFFDGATQQLVCNFLDTGALEVKRSTTVLDTSDTSLVAVDTWYDMEWYTKIDNSAGEFTFKLDDTLIMSASAVDTQQSANAQTDQWRCGNATLDTYMDDCLVVSGQADIGPGQVETLYPDGAGDLAEMTRGGTDSSANWSQCDEAVANGNTDYVLNTVADKRDCYTFQNRSISGTPHGVQVTGTVIRNTSGTFTFKFFCRIGGVNFDGATVHTAPSSYLCFREVWNNNPATGLAWTDSDINGAQFGIHAIDANIRMTQIVIETWVST